MSIPEAIKGARAELARLQSPLDKLRRIAVYSRIFGAELLGTLQILPYGVRAFLLHRSLPEATPGRAQPSVSVLRRCRYGAAPRNVLDVYLPAGACSDLSAAGSIAGMLHAGEAASSGGDGAPMVLFCHGGVWTTGESWQYAPLATRLAQAGIVTAVMQYTLYPQALVPAMVAEVSQALSWTLDRAARLGGSPDRVSLVGHSAGAQLCAMALLTRALGRGAGAAGSRQTGASLEEKDGRMPKRFVGLAGVYDIGKHLEYETSRDVHELSTMARAVGGPANFERCSPAAILAAALRRGGPERREQRSSAHAAAEIDAVAGAASFYGGYPLRGDAIAQRVRLTATHPSSTAASISNIAAKLGSGKPANVSAAPAPLPAGDLLGLTLADASLLPPTVLQSSCSDVTVPWHESAEMHWALTDAGVPCRSLVYNAVGHGDFVVSWRPLAEPAAAAAASGGPASGLPDFAADLVNVLTDQVPGV